MPLEKPEKTEVRIVAGTLKGRKIVCVVHPGMRPTPQFVREALFSILGNAVPGRAFYDVFAGTGVCGLEAISRGASRANLIEKDPKQVTQIAKVARDFGVHAQAVVLRADAYRWAERWIVPLEDEPVNLFLSPPFPDLTGDKLDEFLKLVSDLYAKAPHHSVIALQTEDGFPAERLGDPDQWDVRKYGRNMLCFRVKPGPLEAAPESAESAAVNPA